jgi:hypothetical protein
MNALSLDCRVTASEFRLAFRLLQHANSVTRAIFPSQELLAIEMGVRPRQVRACLSGLIRKGWVKKTRYNRQLSNSYEFLEQHVSAVLDRQQSLKESLDEERQARWSERSKSPSHNRLSGIGVPVATGHREPLPTGAPHPPNTSGDHLNGSPEEHLGLRR